MSAEPDSMQQQQASGAFQATNQNPTPSSGMSINEGVNFGKGLSASNSGLDKTVVDGTGDKNLVEQLGQSPLASATGGKLDAFQALQTAEFGIKGGSMMTAPSLGGHGSVIGINTPEGQQR